MTMKSAEEWVAQFNRHVGPVDEVGYYAHKFYPENVRFLVDLVQKDAIAACIEAVVPWEPVPGTWHNDAIQQAMATIVASRLAALLPPVQGEGTKG